MGVLGGIIYALGTEALTAFARNVSLSKSYTDARLSFGRIGNPLQSSGQVPTPLLKTGAVDTSTGPYYSGVKFYRYGAAPTYAVTTAISLTASILKIRGGAGQDVPLPGDIIVVPGIGFQAHITAAGVSGTSPDWTVTFATTIKQNCAVYLQDNTAAPLGPTPAAPWTAKTPKTSPTFPAGPAGLYYKTEATVQSSRFDVPAGNAVKVTRYFQLTNVPLFQAAIFYENKLEIYPGSDMNVTGLVHTNADIWAQPFSVAGKTVKLQFNSNVSHIGGFNEAS